MTILRQALLYPVKLIFAAALLFANVYLLSLLLTILEHHKVSVPFYTDDMPQIHRSVADTTSRWSSQIASIRMPDVTIPHFSPPEFRMPRITLAKKPQPLPTIVQHPPGTIVASASQPIATSKVKPPSAPPKLKPKPKPKPFVATSPARWPLNGVITTEFGEPHWPYQGTHTGIDISSHNPAGGAAITPFKAGRVAQVVYSDYGLGNRVILDHGGITSVYAHLSSITVREGQAVRPGNVLGHEGSTGTATGTHLHFEVRKNGIPINPRGFLTGNPR